MDLLDLAERCEKAEGPDRALDLAIWNASGTRYNTGAYEAPCCPHFTASIDAALTLVPEGWLFTVASYRGEDNAQPFYADCMDEAVFHGADGDAVTSLAATPALALCAATLRAHPHQGKDHD